MRFVSLMILALVAITLLFAGCTSPQTAAPAATTAATPNPVPPATTSAAVAPAGLAGDWTLTTLGIQGGTAVIYPTTTISLTMNPDGTFTGYDGCNNYFGSYTLTGTTTPKGQGMTVSGVGSSKKYCQDIANQEQQYLNILSKTNAYVVDGAQLTLTGNMGDVLIYQRPQTLVTPKSAPY